MKYRVNFIMDNSSSVSSSITIPDTVEFLNEVFRTDNYVIGGNPVLCITTSKITSISMTEEKS